MGCDDSEVGVYFCVLKNMWYDSSSLFGEIEARERMSLELLY